jgi:hypothetical protein
VRNGWESTSVRVVWDSAGMVRVGCGCGVGGRVRSEIIVRSSSGGGSSVGGRNLVGRSKASSGRAAVGAC